MDSVSEDTLEEFRPRIIAQTNGSSKIVSILEKVALYAVVIFLIVTGFLTLFITAYFPDYSYRVAFSSHSWWGVALAIICVMGFAGILDHFRILQKMNSRVLTSILLIYVSIFGIFWMILANVWPEWDSAEILTAAQQMSNRDMWFFTDAGYFIRFPFQIPFLYFERLMFNIFGSSTYQAIEFINVICSVATVFLCVKLSDALFKNPKVTNITTFFCFTFFPLMFYVTFAYPNILCFPFLLGAFWGQIKHLESMEKRYAVLSIFSAIACVTLKSSMILLILCMLIVWVISFLKRKKTSFIICVIALVITYFISGQGISYISKSQFNIDPAEGLPKTVWIAMGLQANGPHAPDNYGWYNGYPWSWNSDQYDVDTINAEASGKIKKSISEFVTDPKYAAEFFSKKFASEWAEPTFESLLASNWSHGRDIPGNPVMSQREMTHVLHSVYYGKINKFVMHTMDVWQTMILLTAAAAIVSNRKKFGIEFLGLGLFALGTAFLFLVWETQSQYILPAYVVLIPYSGAGLLAILNKISGTAKFVLKFIKKDTVMINEKVKI